LRDRHIGCEILALENHHCGPATETKIASLGTLSAAAAERAGVRLKIEEVYDSEMEWEWMVVNNGDKDCREKLCKFRR
jgi:hypothetical protein